MLQVFRHLCGIQRVGNCLAEGCPFCKTADDFGSSDAMKRKDRLWWTGGKQNLAKPRNDNCS